ncbi:MAG: helix-turn-helix transcriptional regulator [Deferrisomatales bacterium]|nr:helix-turn-helix transcriptional regulator [Deferrisomatales bacterium]
MSTARTYSKYTLEATRLLGQQIKLGRKQQRWSETELAQRAGIARSTLQKIEKGDPTASLGLVFEVAALVGVGLFDADRRGLAERSAGTATLLTLLPKRVHARKRELDDDF